MSKFFGLVILALFAAPAWSATPRLTSDDLRLLSLTKETNITIIDVRTPNAYAKGHIQNARNIAAKDAATSSLPRDAHIVVYCSDESCPAGSDAAKNLKDAGYTKIDILEGGFSDWLKHGYPAESGVPKPRRLKHHRARAHEARQKLDQHAAVPIDVRPTREYQAGHLPGAINAPLEDLEAHFIDLPKDKELIVYDRKARRSRQACDKLKAAGYSVSELSGGLAGWAKRTHPLETK